MRFLFSDEAPLCATWGPPNWRSRFIPGTKPCLATALSIVCYLLARCRLLAQNRHGVMSELSPLCAQKRTWITAVGVCNLRVPSLDFQDALLSPLLGDQRTPPPRRSASTSANRCPVPSRTASRPHTARNRRMVTSQ